MKKAPDLLFITRKWHGQGGMQRLSRDLWQCMRNVYGERARLASLASLVSLASLASMHVHLGDAALIPLGWVLKKLGARRVTVTVCGLDVIWPRMWYQWILKRTLPQVDHVVCISRATAEEVRKRGVREDRISIIPCGVWAEKFQIPSTKFQKNSKFQVPNPILLTVGRLVRRKGHAWFLEHVLPVLIKEYPTLEYWIVGKGPEKRRIESIVQKCGLEAYVRLLGSVSDSEREEWYRGADVFVMPNIQVPGDMEGFGIAAIEASSRGVPVVAARLEGLKDAVIEGKTGWFFESENAEDCISVMKSVLAQEPPLPAGEGWGEGIRGSTIKHFSWPRLFERYRDEVFGF